MSKILLFTILFFLGVNCLADDFQRKIAWQEQNVKNAAGQHKQDTFDGCISVNQSKIPFWFESFALSSKSAEVKISHTVFEPANNSSILDEIVDSDLQYYFEVGNSAGKSVLRLTINPFVRRNNRVERLVDFTISILESPAGLKSAEVAYEWKTTSVLGAGKWVKIKTKSKGIYKITYDQLRTWGYSNPEQVAVYGNGGYLLPTLNSELRYDDLLSYPVWKGKDNAGKDCLFFFSTGNIQTTLNEVSGILKHQQNYYATETYFYLSDQGSQNVIGKAVGITDPTSRKVLSFPNYFVYEKDALNLISSGSQWFGEKFAAGASQTFSLSLDNPDLTKPAQFVVSAAGRSSATSRINVALNGKSVNDISFQAANVSDATADYANYKMAGFTESLPSATLQVRLNYIAGNSNSEAWLDYISVNYQSLLNINSDAYFFRGKGVDGTIPVSEFIIGNATAATKILDITNIHSTTEVPTVLSGGQLSFKSNSSAFREYVAFNPGGSIPVPELVGTGTVANQNLHASESSEMIIVSNSTLLSEANDLADFHRTSDQMSVQVVTPELIYNEFSGGLPDPAAFRNYFRMVYDRDQQSGTTVFKYVLLLGDGSFDNRNIQGNGHNLLPTYQSDNSLSPTESFVTDDFFAFLDENEGGYLGTVDLGVGRIPARTSKEAEIAIAKIKNYHKKETFGNWRNVVTFIGDDEDTSVHMGQAESMANVLNNSYPAFFTDKIYFDAFKQISSSGGESYPEVTAAINNRVKQGTLVMNYTGHANEKFLADEEVLDVSTINSWSNYNRLPIFVTATCEFSRFDSNETSAGEQILFSPSGGGVGLFSTTRLVYSGANFVLNSKFFKYIFEKDQQGNNLRLGDVMRLAKAASNTGINQLNFSLLADPALRLANPVNQIKTTSINGKNAEIEIDTLQTLTVVTVKGYVADNKGAKLSTFNGEIIPTVYDKAIQVETLGNAGEEPMEYKVQNSIIYRGLASVKNGEFEFSFFVPKDISYKLDKGKILYYAYNDAVDAHGFFDNFYIGGSSNAVISDSEGPEIDLFMNAESFRNGGTVSASSVLLVNLSDDTGINTAGTGIGHDITAVLDNDDSNVMVLNDFFQADLDSYTSGKIIFPLTELSEGEHVLRVKVWDVLNNSSEKEIRFVVKDDFRIETVWCYPNPTPGETHFLFTHNQPDKTFDVELEVFESSGSRIDIMQTTVGSQGTQSLPLEWIPTERQVRMRNGVYIYRITATTKDGKKTTSGSGRLVFLRQ